MDTNDWCITELLDAVGYTTKIKSAYYLYMYIA